MDRTISYKIDELNSGMTVREFLKSRHFSSQIISDLKHLSDGIMHNGSQAYVSEKIEAGDTITVNIREANSSEKIPPVKMQLDIIYEDEDLVVVNKPADMPVHPSLNNYENTLANGLAYYYESQGEKFVFRCMNRLDRNTTGAVLVAKNALSGAILSEMIRERRIGKNYVAVVEGRLSIDKLGVDVLRVDSANAGDLSYALIRDVADNSFTIDAPIGRVDGSTIERQVDMEHGERAVTHVTVCGPTKDGSGTVVSCELETGRTHQIRVHMSSIGFPLVGDGLYNPLYKDDVMHRQLLHCKSLEFEHPITHAHVAVKAQYLDDMKEYIC